MMQLNNILTGIRDHRRRLFLAFGDPDASTVRLAMGGVVEYNKVIEFILNMEGRRTIR